MALLWRMCPWVDDVLQYSKGPASTFDAAARVRDGRYCSAYVFPNSFRSALIPFLAGVPERIGVAAHGRSPLLTKKVPSDALPGREHQLWEYYNILGVSGVEECVAERLLDPLPVDWNDYVPFNPAGRRIIGVLPGAARGPSKQWPAEHFVALGSLLAADAGTGILVLGSNDESELCSTVAAGIGDSAISLAGRTNLCSLASVLAACDVAVSNDSGGMHMAAAVGTRVVAVFGLTDPAKTGPVGSGHVVLRPDGVVASRDIERASNEAREALGSVTPDRVYEAVLKVLGDLY